MRGRRAIGAGLVAAGLAAAGCADDSVSAAGRHIAQCTGDQATGPHTPAARPAAMWDFNGDGRADVATKPGGDEEAPGARSFTVLISGVRGTPVCREIVPASHHESLERLYSADVNGDGRADLIETVPGRGVVVHFGTQAGVSAKAVEVIPSPINEYRDFGWSIAAADFNADGYDDLAIGAPGESDGPTYSDPRDSIFIYFGGPRGISLTTSYRIRSPNRSSFFFGGTMVAADFTGDGYADLVETHDAGHRFNPHEGSRYDRSRTLLLLGSRQGPHHPVEVSHRSGYDVVGDVIGGSAQDLIMSTATGWYVLAGRRDGLAKTVPIRAASAISPRTSFPMIGALLDVDGDGRLDAVIDDPARIVGGHKQAGAVEIARGTRRGFDVTDPITVIDATSPGVPGCLIDYAEWGEETTARDLTGDGRPDLLVLAPVPSQARSHRCTATGFLALPVGPHGFTAPSVYARFGDTRDLIEAY